MSEVQSSKTSRHQRISQMLDALKENDRIKTLVYVPDENDIQFETTKDQIAPYSLLCEGVKEQIGTPRIEFTIDSILDFAVAAGMGKKMAKCRIEEIDKMYADIKELLTHVDEQPDDEEEEDEHSNKQIYVFEQCSISDTTFKVGRVASNVLPYKYYDLIKGAVDGMKEAYDGADVDCEILSKKDGRLYVMLSSNSPIETTHADYLPNNDTSIKGNVVYPAVWIEADSIGSVCPTFYPAAVLVKSSSGQKTRMVFSAKWIGEKEIILDTKKGMDASDREQVIQSIFDVTTLFDQNFAMTADLKHPAEINADHYKAHLKKDAHLTGKMLKTIADCDTIRMIFSALADYADKVDKGEKILDWKKVAMALGYITHTQSTVCKTCNSLIGVGV